MLELPAAFGLHNGCSFSFPVGNIYGAYLACAPRKACFSSMRVLPLRPCDIPTQHTQYMCVFAHLRYLSGAGLLVQPLHACCCGWREGRAIHLVCSGQRVAIQSSPATLFKYSFTARALVVFTRQECSHSTQHCLVPACVGVQGPVSQLFTCCVLWLGLPLDLDRRKQYGQVQRIWRVHGPLQGT